MGAGAGAASKSGRLQASAHVIGRLQTSSSSSSKRGVLTTRSDSGGSLTKAEPRRGNATSSTNVVVVQPGQPRGRSESPECRGARSRTQPTSASVVLVQPRSASPGVADGAGGLSPRSDTRSKTSPSSPRGDAAQADGLSFSPTQRLEPLRSDKGPPPSTPPGEAHGHSRESPTRAPPPRTGSQQSRHSGEQQRHDRGPHQSAVAAAAGGLVPGQRVVLKNLESAKGLNGEQGVLVGWDADSGRWIVRLSGGDEFRSRPANLEPAVEDNGQQVPNDRLRNAVHASAKRQPKNQMKSGLVGKDKPAEDANKELEGLLLQTNWSAIYQLFHQRFGIAAMEKLDHGYVVKSAVEMTLSIVAKCFALLRSDPTGRLHCTPLHIAALQSSTEAAEVIVRDLPKLVEQTHRPSHSALCPLHIAVLCGGQAIVELLLEGRADPNVRTLHDVCPLHLAATTSKEMCQVLLAYGADPLKRDVMGSTSMHYATSFKQNALIETLLTWQSGAERLAAESDLKRVTALHISCALYKNEEDLVAPLHLLATGAKLWSTDISGASAQMVAPQGPRGGALQQFFDKAGERPREAAQQLLEERYLASHKDSADDAAGDGDNPRASDDEAEDQAGGHRALRVSDDQGQRRISNRSIASSLGKARLAGAPYAELQSEVERLKQELQDSHARRAELEQLHLDLGHARQKITLLEQSDANQKRVCEDWQALLESQRTQHQAQLAEVQRRHADERAEWEETSKAQLEAAKNEARLKARGEHMAASQVSTLRLQEVELKLRTAEAEVEQQRGKQGEVRAEEEAAAKYQELREAVLLLCAQRGLAQRLDAQAASELVAPIAERLSQEQEREETRTKALQEQVVALREERTTLAGAKAAAEDRSTQLELKVQEAEGRVSATALKLETEIQRLTHENSQAMAKLKASVESSIRRAETAEAIASQAQPTIDSLRDKWMEEQVLRKRLHNRIQDMKGAIRVYCRFRPMAGREKERGDAVVLRKQDNMNVDLRGVQPSQDTKSFQFDSVFDASSTQEEVFSDCQDLVQSAVDGYNVTIFAYGQTGAGKTHTMYGSAVDPGLAPRTIRLLFDYIHKEQKRHGGKKTFKVKSYMIEVYKQDIIDLLSKEPPQKKSLEVKRDPGRGNMYVDGVVEQVVSSPEELEFFMREGEKKRHTGATKMNSESSRSHLLLSIIVECTVQDTGQFIYGKITMCDLAGSERPKKSEVVGDAMKEAIEINKSLSALGDVIEALTKGNKTVPYRNHKLTMLMQDSLGGSAKCLMFVNCSPASFNYEETWMSLKWASRARQVTNDVKRNADSKEVARLKQVIRMMSQAQNAADPTMNQATDNTDTAQAGAAANSAAVAMAATIGRA